MAGTITRRTIARFIEALFAKQSDKYGGDTTLNELRVIACCYRVYTDTGAGTSVTELAQALAMPTSTVHRSVTSLIEAGWLRDSVHPDDRRRRIIRLSEQGIAGGLWETAIDWLEEFSE